jgi:hypothetical protein
MTSIPQLYCRECGKPLQMDWQPALMPGREGKWIVTCHSTKIECPHLSWQTFIAEDYETRDLGDYGLAAQP